MSAFFLSPIGNSSQESATGAPLNAGTITTLQAGTSTPAATYTDNTGGTPQTNPIVLNTFGLPPSPIWLAGGQAYKFQIKDSLGNLVRTVDNISGINDPSPPGVSFGSDGTFDFRNRLINGNFPVNQRAVSGTVTLAAGIYGHDRWKAGSGGCTYTFSASGNSTIITISAGTLMQVVEDKNVEGGFYSLSNQGTAQARIAVSGGTTSGAYAAATKAAPLASASATGNQTMTVEFTTGTLDRVQLEPGTVATTFERRPYGIELALCQRYYEAGGVKASATGSTGTSVTIVFKQAKRATPTMAYANSPQGAGTVLPTSTDWAGTTEVFVASGSGALNCAWTASAEL